MRLTAALVLVSALPTQAQTVDPQPGFPLMLRYPALPKRSARSKATPRASVAAHRAEWIVLLRWPHRSKVDACGCQTFGDRFAKELVFYRAPSYEEGVPATQEEIDEILTEPARCAG